MKAEVRKREENIKEKQQFLDNEIENNSEQEKKISIAERTAARIRSDYQEAETQRIQFQDEVNIQRVVHVFIVFGFLYSHWQFFCGLTKKTFHEHINSSPQKPWTVLPQIKYIDFTVLQSLYHSWILCIIKLFINRQYMFSCSLLIEQFPDIFTWQIHFQQAMALGWMLLCGCLLSEYHVCIMFVLCFYYVCIFSWMLWREL